MCIVDTDEQCNATDGFGINRDQLANEGRHTVLDAYLFKRPARRIAFELCGPNSAQRLGGNLHIVPGHRGLSQVTPKLEAELHSALASDESSTLDADDIRHEQRMRLSNSLETLRDAFDFVFIDTPPDLGFQTTTALIAADWFILPVFPSGYDLKGLEKLIFTTKKVRERYNGTDHQEAAIFDHLVAATGMVETCGGALCMRPGPARRGCFFTEFLGIDLLLA